MFCLTLKLFMLASWMRNLVLILAWIALTVLPLFPQTTFPDAQIAGSSDEAVEESSLAPSQSDRRQTRFFIGLDGGLGDNLVSDSVSEKDFYGLGLLYEVSLLFVTNRIRGGHAGIGVHFFQNRSALDEDKLAADLGAPSNTFAVDGGQEKLTGVYLSLWGSLPIRRVGTSDTNNYFTFTWGFGVYRYQTQTAQVAFQETTVVLPEKTETRFGMALTFGYLRRLTTTVAFKVVPRLDLVIRNPIGSEGNWIHLGLMAGFLFRL